MAGMVLLGIGTGFAQEKKAAAQATGGSPHIEAGVQFLTAWGRAKWDDLVQVASGKVSVAVGGKEYAIDPEGKKSDAALVFPFKGLETVREGGKVKAISVGEITVKTGSEEKKGKATLAVEEKDGKFRVTKVIVE
jgi:hypothetical protein